MNDGSAFVQGSSAGPSEVWLHFRPSRTDGDRMALEERMNAFALLGAEWVMWLLVGLSVICVALAVERAIYLVLN